MNFLIIFNLAVPEGHYVLECLSVAMIRHINKWIKTITCTNCLCSITVKIRK